MMATVVTTGFIFIFSLGVVPAVIIGIMLISTMKTAVGAGNAVGEADARATITAGTTITPAISAQWRTSCRLAYGDDTNHFGGQQTRPHPLISSQLEAPKVIQNFFSLVMTKRVERGQR